MDKGVKYRDVRYTDELQYSVYNFELADIPTLWKLFEIHEGEARRLIDALPEYGGEETLSTAADLRSCAEVQQSL